MLLSKDEAICLVLGLSDKKEVSSVTKLNKLLARLNLHFIPIDLNFNLNKYGSFSTELKDLQTNQYYEVSSYEYKDISPSRFTLKPAGEELFKETVHLKLDKIFTQEDFVLLKSEIFELSKLNASEISNNEHKKLLIDVENRFKLKQKANTVHIDVLDLYDKINKIPSDTMSGIRLRAVIEYCFYLTKYLKEKFEKLSEDEYNYDAYMNDYYFLHNIAEIIPFLSEQVQNNQKDPKSINKYYQYIINSVNNYPFSLENKELHRLIAQ